MVVLALLVVERQSRSTLRPISHGSPEISKLDPDRKLEGLLLGSWSQGTDYAPAGFTVHTGVRVPQVDLIEDIEDVGPKTQIGALGHGNGLGDRNVALKKAGPSEGIAANVSNLACTCTLP